MMFLLNFDGYYYLNLRRVIKFLNSDSKIINYIFHFLQNFDLDSTYLLFIQKKINKFKNLIIKT